MSITNKNYLGNKLNMISIVLLLLFVSYTKEDLPVHCVLSDIVGSWKFMIDKHSFTPSLKNEQTTCGHGFPNKVVYGENEQDGESVIIPSETKYIDIKSDYKLYENGKEVGNWTPVYDQAFLLYYKNSIINSPFKYFLKDNVSNEFVSDCGRSLMGWIIPDKTDLHSNWRCFYAIKVKSEAKTPFLQKQKTSLIEIKHNNPSPLLFELKYEELENMVDEINHSDLSWKASINPKYKGLNLVQLRKKLGLNKGLSKLVLEKYQQSLNKGNNSKKRKQSSLSNIETDTYQSFIQKLNKKESYTPKIKPNTNHKSFVEKKVTLKEPSVQREPDSKDVTDPDEITKYIHTKLEDIDENKIAKNWDWRNVGGESYIPEVVEQGDCGACYTFSSIFSLESRLRILSHNKDKTKFSIQFPLSCNFYAEGCDGGFPILVGKFLSEFEIVPEECFKYTQTTNKCDNVCDYEQFPKKYVVSEYGYLGGFYGATSEALMMKEIRARGPIPGNIKVPIQFNYYQSGIFSSSELKKNADKLNKVRMVDKHLNFEKVEHSITLVGYGEENGVKYWIGMNTWGKDWGDGGFFKILRGENELNIETMGDYLNLEVLDRKTGKKIEY